MNSIDRVQAVRRVYRVKTWQRVLYVFLALFFLGPGAILGLAAIAPHRQNVGIAVFIAAGFLAAGVYTACWALRSRMTIDATRIDVRGAFGERSLDRSDVEGFRTIQTRYGSYKRLVVKGGQRAINISSSFATDDDFRAWMQEIPDLDDRDRKALLDKISNDQELGATPEERLGALARAKRQNIGLFAIALAAALGVNFGPVALERFCAVVLALAPLVTAYLCWSSPLLFAVFKKKTDPRAETCHALLISGLSLIFENSGRHFVSLQAALSGILVFSLLIAIAYSGPVLKSTNPGAALVVLFLAPLYGLGVTSVSNALFDGSAGNVYSTQVVGQHKNSGRSTTYYLRLEPWGPVETSEDVSVSSHLYYGTSIGDTVCPELHAGSLHIPWFQIIPCATAPQPIQ